MTQQELISKLENQYINSLLYGRGRINKVRVDGDNVYFDIVFIINEVSVNKTFSATIALEKKVLEFEETDVLFFYHELKKTLAPSVKKDENVISKSESIDNDNIFNREMVNNGISSLKEINDIINTFSRKESITQQLIKNYDNYEFEETLCNEGFSYFEKKMNGLYIKEDCKKEIIILLSYLALKYYDGELVYTIINKYRKYREENEAMVKGNTIYNTLCKILGPYKKEVKYFNDNANIAVPIIYSSVPHYRVPQLYKISYDLYRKKLLFDEDVTDSQIEKKVEECLNALKRKDLISDSESIKGTEYLMSKYTQSTIYSGFNLKALIEIISRCIRLIINHLTRQEDSFEVEPYYKEGYDLWVTEFDNNTKEREKYEKSRILSRPYFILKNKKNVWLNTGKYCMDDSYNPQNVKIQIYSGSKLIRTYDLNDPNDVLFNNDVSMGGYIINRKEFLLECSPIDNISYKIICDEEEIYSSTDRLFRKVLFFDGSGNEVKAGTEYDGDIFVISHELEKSEEDSSNSSIISENDDYIISFIR